MKSQYGLNYVIVDKKNLDIAFKIQKETWTNDSDYENLYDKAVNTKDDNCFFLVYDNEILIGLTGVDVFREYPDTIWLDYFTILPEYRKKGLWRKSFIGYYTIL